MDMNSAFLSSFILADRASALRANPRPVAPGGIASLTGGPLYRQIRRELSARESGEMMMK
jgi:hypothetical protein